MLEHLMLGWMTAVMVAMLYMLFSVHWENLRLRKNITERQSKGEGMNNEQAEKLFQEYVDKCVTCGKVCCWHQHTHPALQSMYCSYKCIPGDIFVGMYDSIVAKSQGESRKRVIDE